MSTDVVSDNRFPTGTEVRFNLRGSTATYKVLSYTTEGKLITDFNYGVQHLKGYYVWSKLMTDSARPVVKPQAPTKRTWNLRKQCWNT